MKADGVTREGVKCILFDAVGTILRPDPPVVDIYHRMGQRYGSGRTPEEIRARFAAALERYSGYSVLPATSGTPRRATRVVAATSEPTERRRWRNIVGHVFDDVVNRRDELFADLWQHFAAARHWRLFDDVEPTWRALAQAGYRLGIASNFDDRLTGICRDMPLLRQAEACFISSQLGYPKPHVRFYREIERRLGLAGEQLLLVGDNDEHDVAAPRRLGWQALHVVREEFVTAPALASLIELIPLLTD